MLHNGPMAVFRVGHLKGGLFHFQLTRSGRMQASQGVQRPGKPGNVREFRCKEKVREQSGLKKKSQEISRKSKVRKSLGNFIV